ncbi:MAG TPA: ParB/RepB/Spo0J family partition protein [Planctomycetota bacterium]|nr:ParB/RepB/Spo0J family partition protein [Planctomycetota bacterium]
METTRTLPLRSIHPNPDNPRVEAGDVTDLAQSIRTLGLIDPLLVIPASWIPGENPEDEQFMIEDGYRRWVALKSFAEVAECRIRIPDPGEDLVRRAIITAMATSLHRVGLGPMERARAYGRLRDEGKLTHAQIAALVGVGESTVSASIMLLELAPSAQKRVEEGKLKVADAESAIKRHRAIQREKKGSKPIDVGWEPDHFTTKHHLARKARALCDAREHNNRRRLDGVACGQCFEDAIRQDQTTILQAAYLESQREGMNPTFLPPFLTADGAPRNGVVGNAV